MAFRLYPQLIAHFCNSEAFGLSRSFTSASSWPWIAHLVSCLLLATRCCTYRTHLTPFSDSLSLRLRVYSPLTSPQKVTRWLILQKARGQGASAPLPPLVSTRFQVLFHSGYPGSFHLSLTVLVHYRSPKVFSLGEWSPLLPTGLACPVVLKLSPNRFGLSVTGLSPSMVGLSSAFLLALRWSRDVCGHLSAMLTTRFTQRPHAYT